MSRICELHDQAMAILGDALQLRETGQEKEAIKLLLRACALESESASMVEKTPQNEPSRSMLFLGAASIARLLKDYNLAERYIFDGLSGFPPDSVREDLEQLYDNVKFERNWEVTSQDISPDEALVRFHGGSAIGFGNIITKQLTRRLESLEMMVSRWTQRLFGLDFDASAKARSALPAYALNLSWDKPGSFGFKISLTYEANQHLPLIAPPPFQILQDVITNIGLVGNGNDDKVRENIHNEEYSENFIAQAKNILPDGRNVKIIGIKGNKVSFKLDKTKKELYGGRRKQDASRLVEQTNDMIYRGYLKISNGVKNTFTLYPEDDAELPKKIHVANSLDELAKQYFGDLVEIQCEKKNSKLYLTDITGI